MVLISLGIIDKNLITILIGCIFCFLNRLLNQYEKTLLLQNPIINSIYFSISRFLTVIPFIILKIKTKKPKSTINVENINKNAIELIFTDNSDENEEGKLRYIILSAFIYLIQFALQFLLKYKLIHGFGIF